MSSQIHDIESENLAAHVSICQERYKQLDQRIDSVEKKLTGIDITLCEIRDAIQSDRKAQFKQFLTWAGVIITVLLGSLGWLLTHYVLR
jgi:hypothetical protein